MDWDGKERRVNPLCKIHGQELKEIWLTLRGNGHPEDGLAYKVQLIVDRQKPLFDFVHGFRKVFWICLPICLGGALCAIWQTLKLLIEHGKL